MRGLMEEKFNIEKYRQENPMDYLKAIELIKNNPTNGEVMNTIYKITRFHIPDTLYKYYYLSESTEENSIRLKTLKDKKVYMADCKSLNDPFDNKAFFYKGEELTKYDMLKEYNGRLIDDFSSFHRISCFTSNSINCMPMWAHYSNNHKGYCVAYDMNNKYNMSLRSCMFSVQYVDKRIDITSVMEKQIENILREKEKTMELGKKEILINDLTLVWISSYYSCLKHISWNYENEFRCSIAANAKGIPFMNAMPKAIYVGNKCSEINKKHLDDIAYILNIPIYFMGFDECSLDYELIPKNIL
jgi:hypothetical protein